MAATPTDVFSPGSATQSPGIGSTTNTINNNNARPSRSTTQFSIETFSTPDFIVKDFVEALSESSIPTFRRPNQPGQLTTQPPSNIQAFDPKPLIRSFEQALNGLKTLSEDLEVRENELSTNVRRAEGQHVSNITSRAAELEKSLESFRDLERNLSGGGKSSGNAAVRIGEKLEELDKQLQRAQDARFVLMCWVEVSTKGELKSLDDVRRQGGGGGKVRCAKIARQLLKISQRMQGQIEDDKLRGMNDPRGQFGSKGLKWKPQEVLERFLETLEKDLLGQFDEYYRKQNFDKMKECAAALKDFGDGSSVMSMFVNQHQFFIDRSQLVTDEMSTDTTMWEKLADPEQEPPGIEQSLQSLVDEVRVVAQEESFIIKKAFPYYEEVLERFLQRVFQQPIQQKLEQVLDKANSISVLAFLRSLQSSKAYISQLVDELKAHGLTENPEAASTKTCIVLDQQLDDLFSPYLAAPAYIDREKRSLEELYSFLLFKFTTFHARRRKVPVSYLGSLQARGKEMVVNARERYLDRLDSADIPVSQKEMLAKLAGLGSYYANRDEVDLTENDGKLNVQTALRMLKWLAESVGRGLELANGHETPKDVRELLNILIEHMGDSYLEVALNAALDSAPPDNLKVEPDYIYLEGLRECNEVLHLMAVTIKTVIMPLAASNLTIKRELDKRTDTFIDKMESKFDVIINKTIDAARNWTSKLLSNQKKSDFRIEEHMQTPTSIAICAFLNKTYKAVAAVFSGPVLDSFGHELALEVRSLLLVHFRSFQVSLTGGIVVKQDMTLYVDQLKKFNLPKSFDSSLEILMEIPNIFALSADALKDRLRGIGGQTLLGVEKADLKPYILKREDAYSVQIQSALTSL